MRHLLSNIISAFFFKKSVRDKIRTMIRFPQTREYVKFVRKFAQKLKRCDIRTMVGYGCHNFVVILNNKYVFKFPLLNDGRDVSIREKKIVDAFRNISPIKIPDMQIMFHKGITIRRYEFAHGILLTDVSPAIISAHRKHIAKQLAEFMYVVGQSDPDEIRDLKPNADDKPGFMYGWFQDDIWQNFMLDPKTFNITFFIDWENAKFGDFSESLYVSSHNWDKFGYRGIIVDVMAEYAKLYIAKQGK